MVQAQPTVAGFEQELEDLSRRCASLRTAGRMSTDLVADAALFLKAVAWALRYRSDGDAELIRKGLDRGRQRLTELEAGRHPWTAHTGRMVRGFVSDVDGSTQLFGLIVPPTADLAQPIRLDVYLHGSMRSDGLSELRFLSGFDDAGAGREQRTDGGGLELHPLGRVGENAYRFAGETDVFEAIEAVYRSYPVDRDRIVLRGMSLGGVGAWRLGLTHPDVFVALGPYAGPMDTVVFSHSPMGHFRKVERLEPVEQSGLRLVDPIDYAANAAMVPVVAAVGKQDPYFLSHLLAEQTFAREGVPMASLVSPETGHTTDPVLHQEQLRLLGEAAARGLDRAPRSIRFVTWSLRCHRCHWLEVLALRQHYARAEVRARADDDGSVAIDEIRNVTGFALSAPVLTSPTSTLTIAGVPVAIPEGARPSTLSFALHDGRWVCIGDAATTRRTGKRPGLQGPIDDAFSSRFLCVRGTGRPWNPAVAAWAEASMERFAREWHRYYRGDLPMKTDAEVTDEDVRGANLICFGDPGSNPLIAQALPALPVRWTRDEVGFGTSTHPAASHAPALIHPHPSSPDRYLVINSGHTFHESEFGALSYLVYPRLGDWAMLRVADDRSAPGYAHETVATGFFGESWEWVEPGSG
jgi:hypothetical protein